jgi:hypothetical protein
VLEEREGSEHHFRKNHGPDVDERHAFDRSGFPVLMTRGALAVLTAAALIGCSTPSTGVVPRGDGMSTITRQGNGLWVTTESLKIAALQDAGDHYAKLGQRMKFIHSKEMPAGPLGRWPESEVLFRYE